MATTSELPPLGPLFNANAKRTYSVFAANPDAGYKDDEKRYVYSVRLIDIMTLITLYCSARMRLSSKIEG